MPRSNIQKECFFWNLEYGTELIRIITDDIHIDDQRNEPDTDQNIFNKDQYTHFIDTIALSFSVSISISYVTIISNRRIRTIIFTISSDFCPDDVIRSSPDVTWNSNWPTWKSFNSFLGRILESSAGPHGKPCLSHWIWMDLIRRKFVDKRYLLRDLRWWSSRKRRCCYIKQITDKLTLSQIWDCIQE